MTESDFEIRNADAEKDKYVAMQLERELGDKK